MVHDVSVAEQSLTWPEATLCHEVACVVYVEEQPHDGRPEGDVHPVGVEVMVALRDDLRPNSMSVVAFTIVCDSPDCPSIFALESREHLTISSFATVIGDRMEAAGWTKSQHGNDLCPECSHRPGMT